jgi:predicted nucleic acid-binding protein
MDFDLVALLEIECINYRSRKADRQAFVGIFRPTSSSTGTRRMPGSFFDSNVLLYVASGDSFTADRAERLIGAGGIISVQVMNEIANVARRKTGMSWTQTRAFLSTIRGLRPVQALAIEVHETGLVVAERYGLSTCDAMIRLGIARRLRHSLVRGYAGRPGRAAESG